LGRPFDKHVDNDELNALVPSSAEATHELQRLSPDAVREAECHVLFCADCSSKVSKYQRLMYRVPNTVFREAAPRNASCPRDEDVDWHEVATGLWPELKTRELIKHAALCDHCGPLLRGATSANDKAELKMPAPSDRMAPRVWPSRRWQLMKWLAPAMALLVIVGVLYRIPLPSRTPISGPKFAEFAVNTHRQHKRGLLALDVLSGSQQKLNEWFQSKLQFSLALPASPAVPGEQRPYHLEGARLVQVGSKTAAYIAYQGQQSAASLMVTPDSVAVASGGVELDFKKVSFHYAMVEGYKVVTWSAHGLTYALVSEEGKSTQQSCMVCHSAMRDRDLSQTPTPLRVQGNTVEPVVQ
jgi:anti-sigma factor RsiW